MRNRRRSKTTTKSPSQKRSQKGPTPPSKQNQFTNRAVTSNAKKKVTRPRTSEQYFALSEAQQDTWNRVTHVIAKMRSEKISLTKASREFGLNPKAVQARAGSALRKTKSGRYVARPSDKLLRVFVIRDSQGSKKEVAVRDSVVASKIGEYHDAVRKFAHTGDSS